MKEGMAVTTKMKAAVCNRMTLIGASMMVPAIAQAQQSEGISSWFVNIGAETSIIVGILVTIIGAVGVGFVGFGIISAVMAKKNREPMQHQPWMIVGGVVAILLIPFIMALGTSVSGEQQGEQDVQQFLESQ